MNYVLRRSMTIIIAVVLTLGGFFRADASPLSTASLPVRHLTSVSPNANTIPSRTTTYYLADRVINNADFAKLAGWGINTAIVDFDVNGSASVWRTVFTSAAAANIDVVIWPSDWNDPRPNCGWEAPYPVSAAGDITKVKRLLDVASQYSNFIGIVNAHESFWTCDISFDEMAGLKDQLKAYALSKGRSIKVWNYIDNLYDKSMLPDNQIERIMDVAVTWQHCAGNVEGTCNTASSTSALNMILNDRKRIADSGAQVELVFIIQTFTTGGYTTKFTLNQLQDYGCQFLNTSALDGFGFYTWHAGWWSDLHSWPELQPAVPYIYNSCTRRPGNQPSTISGNAGAAGITLSYMDGALQTVTTDANGNYSITVPYGWSGTVTPYKTGYLFTPLSRSYDSLKNDRSAQSFTLQACANCADVGVLIGASTVGNYTVASNQSVSMSYATLIGGPVKVKSLGGGNIFTSQRAVFGNSFNELTGFPSNQLTTDYWFTYYDDIYMATWLMIGNPDPVNSAHVEVYIGAGTTPIATYDIPHGQSVLPRYGIARGPVRVKSTNGVNIFTSQRAAYLGSFNELMGFPADQLTTDYWFTYYDDIYMSTWLMIGNPDPVNSAHVEVYLGNSSTPIFTRDLAHGESVLPRFGVAGGPLRVKSTNGVNIFTSQRAAFGNSFNELMGFPANQLTTDYWFTYYDDVSMSTWLMIGNPDPVNSAHVEVYLGAGTTPIATYDLAHGQSVLPKYSIAGGPLRVKSTNGVNIFTSERVAYGNSFNELMGLPADQLTTDYWFTWYDNVYMQSNILVAQP